MALRSSMLPMETVVPFQASGCCNVKDLTSRIRELEETVIETEREYTSVETPNSALLKQCATELEINVMQIVEECSNISSLGTEELDAYLNQLKEELSRTEVKSAKISEEFEILSRKTNEDFLQFESNLQGLKCSLEHIQRQTEEEESEKYPGLTLLPADDNELQESIERQQMEQCEESLRIFEKYDNLFERWEAVKNVENLFACTNVVDFDGNNIHLQLNSFVNGTDNSIDIQHQMVIEVHPESMNPSNVKISPNDVYIDGLVTAAGASSYSSEPSFTNSLERLVRQVQQRIVQCYTRQGVAKDISKNPRSPCKYVDKDEAFVVQLPGEVNACIKVAEGWPGLTSPLQLISLRSKSGKVSDLLHKVNSLNLKDQCDLLTFIEAIDDAVGKHM